MADEYLFSFRTNLMLRLITTDPFWKNSFKPEKNLSESCKLYFHTFIVLLFFLAATINSGLIKSFHWGFRKTENYI